MLLSSLNRLTSLTRLKQLPQSIEAVPNVLLKLARITGGFALTIASIAILASCSSLRSDRLSFVETDEESALKEADSQVVSRELTESPSNMSLNARNPSSKLSEQATGLDQNDSANDKNNSLTDQSNSANDQSISLSHSNDSTTTMSDPIAATKDEARVIRGLNTATVMILDRWYQELSNRKYDVGALAQSRKIVVQSKDALRLPITSNLPVESIIAEAVHRSLSLATLTEMASALVNERERIRHLKTQASLAQEKKRQILWALQIMLEELLYVVHQRHSVTDLKTFVFASELLGKSAYAGNNSNSIAATATSSAAGSDSEKNPNSEPSKGQLSSVAQCDPKFLLTYQSVEVCSGDILASKGSAPSSTLISSMGQIPSAFSHSTVSFLPSDSKQAAYVVEALIEDGVKIRVLENYGKESKKLSVFRMTGQAQDAHIDTAAVAVALLDRYESLANAIASPTADSPYSSSEQPVANYDFRMDPLNSDRYFCSEVSYEIYTKAFENSEFANDYNPYGRPYWSQISGDAIVFFESVFGIEQSSLPAPGDVELNPYFDLMSASYALDKLAEDRIDAALVDALYKEISNPQSGWPEFFVTISERWNTTATKDQIQEVFHDLLTHQGSRNALREVLDRKNALQPLENAGDGNIDSEQSLAFLKSKFNEAVAKLPEEMTLKQVVAFALINEVIISKLKSHFLENSELARTACGGQDCKTLGRGELFKAVYPVLKAKLTPLREGLISTITPSAKSVSN
ncbi:MAG: hypothetical protein COT74_10360 [Bdellovibrionales bacterium CG10_big_fil_rev_8_21_14_0_10_45_34]|nr:MAG: hypothetical protein COT74_10360 [Bdellovibrionales bacterium CG10_big_fil_rev_8_21_14_0_10_45_34]